jgi:hypothetical protein
MTDICAKVVSSHGWSLPVGFAIINIIALILALTGNLPDGV